jgi:hypothetical protein
MELDDTPEPELMWMLLGMPVGNRLNDESSCRALHPNPRKPQSFWSARTLYAHACDQLIPPAPVLIDAGLFSVCGGVVAQALEPSEISDAICRHFARDWPDLTPA